MTKETQEKVPLCSGCGEPCWVQNVDVYRAYLGPCEGKISVSEDYPGSYTHFCEKHGHPEDLPEEQKMPRAGHR